MQLNYCIRLYVYTNNYIYNIYTYRVSERLAGKASVIRSASSRAFLPHDSYPEGDEETRKLYIDSSFHLYIWIEGDSCSE